jgi:MFS family permease
MLKRIIYRWLRNHHFWRSAGFDELSEIYVSMLFRSLALSMMGIFVPVFLIKIGYSLSGVASFYAMYFACRTVWDIAAGYIVARIGPKHTILYSYLLQIAAAAVFMTLPDVHWPLLLPAILWAASFSFFHISFHVDFSKIKHPDHGGKELGHVHIMERIGGAIGPLAGGLLATVIGAQAIFLVAIVVLLTGVIPLFQTTEPVKIHQQLNFKTLPLARLKRDLFSYTALIVETNLLIVMWPLFLTLFVFMDNTYAFIGVLSSIGILTSIAGTYYIGRAVDNKGGGKMLRMAAIGNSLLYCLRPFATSAPLVLGANITGEIMSIAQRLPFMKGVYDAADRLPGHRIVYIVVLESLANFVKTVVWLHLYLLTFLLRDRHVLVVGFGVASVASLLVLVQRFPALAYTRGKHG